MHKAIKESRGPAVAIAAILIAGDEAGTFRCREAQTRRSDVDNNKDQGLR
jgi:hypothetical protein